MSPRDRPEDADPNSPWGGPSQRGLKVRKRDDYGVDLFRRALEHFLDRPHLGHALLELTRAYDPVTNGPILALAMRRRILALLDTGQDTAARQLLEECLTGYTRRGDPDSPDRPAHPDRTGP